MTLTLDLSNSTCKDVFLGPFVLDRLQDVLDDGLCEGSLLFLFRLLLITDPGVQNGFKLRSQSNVLLQDERLRLKFCCFLNGCLSVVRLAKLNRVDLGEGKETLGDGNDILHLSDRVDSVFDGLSVFRTSTVEDTLNFVNLGLGPITVGFADGLECNSRVKLIVTVQ
jgi:hypothetical protein